MECLLDSFNVKNMIKIMDIWSSVDELDKLEIGDLVVIKNEQLYEIYYDDEMLNQVKRNKRLSQEVLVLLKKFYRCTDCDTFQMNYHYSPETCDTCMCNMCVKKPDDNCCICLENLNQHSTIQLSCEHYLHIACEKKIPVQEEEDETEMFDIFYKKCPLCRKKYQYDM